MKSRWIDHNGQRIIYADYAHFNDDIEGLKKEVNCVEAEIVREPEGSVRFLVDVRETAGIPEITDHLTKAAIAIRKYVRKTGVIGVSGFRKLLVRSIAHVSGMELTLFEDMDEALDWLAE